MLAFSLLLAALIGLSLGLLGSGGSIVTLPVLVYVARVPAHEAVGMSLLIVGATSALGSLINFRRGNFDLRAGMFFGVSGIVGAFVGSKFTHLVSAQVLLLCFGALMLVVGIRMLLVNEAIRPGGLCRPLRCFVTGVVVGLLTGFLGVGGGFVILPALVLFAGLEMKTAVGTSLAVIAVNSLAGLLGQFRYVQFEWALTLAFLSAAAIGMISGLILARRISSGSLRRAFAFAIVALGTFIIVKNLLS
ncbi:MAG TPA: sulfite exporter TauE/SafE family protein [Terriglobia bacterium]|nr:sulfite exporter TauE/SafE family protein [Terriglobia bacterium]